MKNQIKKLFILGALLMIISLPLAFAACSKGSSQARKDVDEARNLIGSSQPLLEDLASLNDRFNTLGAMFNKVEDTLAEGKSLADMAMIDVDELESRYSQARDLFNEVIAMDDAGDYAQYSMLALPAVEATLQRIGLNRELLTAVSDMLDVVPMAENQDQLSYYVGRIDELSKEMAQLDQQVNDAAQASDDYFKEHKL